MPRVQAKHIPSELILEFMDIFIQIPRLHRSGRGYYPVAKPLENPLASKEREVVFLRDFERVWPDVPIKVIKEKLRNMEAKKLIFGGSYESYTMLPKGSELLWQYRFDRENSQYNVNDKLDFLLNPHKKES